MPNYGNDANCKGYWGMEDSGTENDLSANNEDLDVSAGDTIEQSVDKKFGTYSRDFERGDADYLQHADGGSTDISGANQKISFCAWFKKESAISTQYVLGKFDTGGNQRQYAMSNELSGSAVLRCHIDDNGTGAIVAVGATALSTATWYHGCGVSNDTDIRAYLNGSLDSNGASNPIAYTAGIYAGTAPFLVGASFNSGAYANGMDGLIDDVAVFDRELTSAEVSDIFTNGIAGVAGFLSLKYQVAEC
jgi:hypothetical protein